MHIEAVSYVKLLLVVAQIEEFQFKHQHTAQQSNWIWEKLIHSKRQQWTENEMELDLAWIYIVDEKSHYLSTH